MKKSHWQFNPIALAGALFLLGAEFLLARALLYLWTEDYHILDQLGGTLVLGTLVALCGLLFVGLLYVTVRSD